MNVRGHDWRCGACNAVVPSHHLRSTAAHPLGEADCPQCGTRVANDDGSSWRGWMRVTFLALGVVGAGIALREWPDGTWWPGALMFATSLGMLLWFRFAPAARVLLPVMRY